MNDLHCVSSTDTPSFLASKIPPASAEQALFHIIPAPLASSGPKGAGLAQGPGRIIHASSRLETCDGFSNPASLGIHTHPPVNSNDSTEVLDKIASIVKTLGRNQHLPILLGGDNCISYAAVRGLLDAGVRDLGVVQIDAHARLHCEPDEAPPSPRSVMKRILDLNVPVFQLGVRVLTEEELSVRKRLAIPHIDGEQAASSGVTDVPLRASFPSNVFFSVSLDGFDPSLFPGTSAPVPGGIGWYQALRLFESVAKQRNIAGFAITDLVPIYGFDVYEFSAALLCYKMMGITQRSR